jgi:flavorubredoxin
MTITNAASGTRIDEVGDRIFRINTPFRDLPGGFSFNQYLVDDDEPLLFHTGPRQSFPLVLEAIAHVMPLDRLRWIGFSHVESDECGALNQLLAVAPRATPLCSTVAAMVSMNDLADRTPRPLADGEEMATGRRHFRWIDAPHVPHGWENGFLFESTTKTLFCGDLFTQPGADTPPVTTGDVLAPSEAFRQAMDYWAHAKNTTAILGKIAESRPTTLACMHGSAWQGDGAALVRALSDAVAAT